MWEDPDEAGNTESLNPNDSSFPGEETSLLQVGVFFSLSVGTLHSF